MDVFEGEGINFAYSYERLLRDYYNRWMRNPLSIETEAIFQAGNPHVKYLELDSHGYSIVDVTAARLQMDWYYISERSDPQATQQFATAFQVRSGTNVVEPAASPAPRRV